MILDTAHQPGWVAVAQGNSVRASRPLEESRRHARDLTPKVRELLDAQGWRARDLTAVLVSRGPGSYTGLRVGIMSAKMLAYATGCGLLGVDTFAAIARQADPALAVVAVLADAQQGKIYVQHFVAGAPGPLEIKPFAAWLTTVQPGTAVTGPGVAIFADQLPTSLRLLPREIWLPGPEAVLALGRERWQRGERDDPFTLEPVYHRASSAEEKVGSS